MGRGRAKGAAAEGDPGAESVMEGAPSPPAGLDLAVPAAQLVVDPPAPPASPRRMVDLPGHSRPREKLEELGAGSLTLEELLAIIIKTGTSRKNALQVAESLVQDLGGVRGLAASSLDQMREIDGIGRVKALELTAVLELARRFARVSPDESEPIRTAEDVVRRMLPELRYELRERLVVLVLDSRNKVRRQHEVSVGTQTESLVGPREVFEPAIRYGGVHIILVHNHPSGDPSPSSQDIASTRRIVEAGRILGIDVLDHIIIGDGGHTSLKQLGYI